jgi:hypothetical protein
VAGSVVVVTRLAWTQFIIRIDEPNTRQHALVSQIPVPSTVDYRYEHGVTSCTPKGVVARARFVTGVSIRDNLSVL